MRRTLRQLVEQGKVKLDDPVENVLPEIKEVRMVDGSEPKNKITLRMLVSCCCLVPYVKVEYLSAEN